MRSATAPSAHSGVSPSGRHIPALDGVRGLAVLLVFVFRYGGGTHSSFRPMYLFSLANKGGWSGVVLFFVLSGFLITGILWDSFADPHWWRKFFARRVLRIFPLYYLALFIVLLGAISRGAVHAVAARLWIPAFFLENLPRFVAINDNLPSATPIFHLWSIAVEEQFYLLWPFLLVVQRSRRAAQVFCLVLFVASAIFRFLIASYSVAPAAWGSSLPVQGGALALGGFVALCFRGPEWPRLLRAAPFAAATGLAGFALSGWLSHDLQITGRFMMTFGLPSITLLFAAIVALATRPGAVARVFSVRWLRWLGTISYGVYVFHILLLPIVEYLTRRLTPPGSPMLFNAVQFLVAAAVSLAAATLSFYLYEKQLLRLKRYFVPARLPSPAARRAETAP